MKDAVELIWLHDDQEAITLHFTYPSAEAASAALDVILDALERHRRAGAGSSAFDRDPAVEQGDQRRLPYPWCFGAPTQDDCRDAGYCRRNPSCGD